MNVIASDIVLAQDGDKWMCVKGDFANLQESPSWWGETPEQALIEYTTQGNSDVSYIEKPDAFDEEDK